MLIKKDYLNTGEVMTLLSWLKSESIVLRKKFNFDYLMMECSEDETGQISVDTGVLDDLMYDLYSIYSKFVKKEDMEEKMEENPMFKILPKDLINEQMRSMDAFITLYERLIMECKFENSGIRGIQKNMLTDLLTKFVLDEDYEKCIEIKQSIKNV